jgi:hypothetical protein
MDKTTKDIRSALTYNYRDMNAEPDQGKAPELKRPSGDASAGRYQVQGHFGKAPINGFAEDSENVHKYGLGDSVIIAGIIQGKIGFFDYIPAQTKRHYYELFGGMNKIGWREIGKNVSQEKMIDYTFQNAKEEGNVMILSPTLGLAPDFKMPLLAEYNPDEQYRDKVCYSFDNSPEHFLGDSFVANWRKANKNGLQVGKMAFNLKKTAHILTNCHHFEGSLNGMAFLAAASGKQVTLWLPQDDTLLKQDPLYKTRLRIMKNYGATIKRVGEKIENTGVVKTSMKTADL